MATEKIVNHTNLISIEPNLMLGIDNDIEDMSHYEGEETELDEGEWAGVVITLADEDTVGFKTVAMFGHFRLGAM